MLIVMFPGKKFCKFFLVFAANFMANTQHSIKKSVQIMTNKWGKKWIKVKTTF